MHKRGLGKLLAQRKPSGTYVKVRLLQRVKFREDEPPRDAGEEIVCDARLANSLADRGLAAILYEEPDRRIVVAQRMPSRREAAALCR